jgi:photosystem II stability/assembly factor-like uncharacterized protein
MFKVRVPASFLVTVFISATAVSSFAAASVDVRSGVLPLYFEANHGQADERAQFFARGREHTIYLGADGATIALKQEIRNSSGAPVSDPARWRLGNRAGSETGAPADGKGRGEGESKIASDNSTIRLVRLSLPGSNPGSAATPQEKLPGRVNYLLGNNPAQWQQGVATFGKVRYGHVYPGVDLIYYGNEQDLEYDFEIAPGVDPSVIAIRFDGADRMEIDGKGDVVLHVGDTQLRQRRPVAYQTIGGSRREIPARYQLKDRQTIVFALGRYDRAHSLVIDPILSYSTYLGGSKGDIGWAIAVDANGSAYVAGDTLSVFKKLPVSGEQTNSGGGTKYGGDAFIARLDFNGTNLSLGYLTYFGGNGLDGGIGIAVDGAGAAYVTGYTTSSNFPVFLASGAPALVQTNIGGTNLAGFNSHYSDAFLTKLDMNGFGVYSTYLGGEFSETGSDVVVDAAGAAYVVGYTDSALIYRATNWVQTTVCTNSICGAAKNATNTALVRLLVASAMVTNTVVKTNLTTTNIIDTIIATNLIGSTQLTVGFPIAGAVQTNNAGAGDFQNADLFVSKVSPDGSALIYSTYLGGGGDDFGTGIGVAADGTASVAGWTESADFPVTNALQFLPGGRRDAVVARLDASGSSLIFSTYLGGAQNDVSYRLAVDPPGNTYVTGGTGSSDFPSTPGALNKGGVFASDAGGSTWTNTSSGILHTIIRTVLADPFNAGVLFAGTPRGVFKSTDNGATWSASNTGMVNRSVNTLAMDPTDGTPLLAGTTVGLFQSSDGGLSWTNDSPGLGTPDVRAILFTPGSPTNLYVGTSAGVFVNTNLATNWLARNSGLSKSVRALVADPGSPTTLYAGTDGGVYKSTNGGINWRSASSGLKTKTSRALVLDPSSPETLYLGTTKGFYKSVNAATNWTLLTNGLNRPSINALLLDTSASSTIYAGTTNGLFKSTDAGMNWFPSQSNLTTLDVSALAFPAGSTATLYAGTRGTNFAGGTNDAFLVKFAPDGQSLVYAFTIGGDKNDEAWDVAVDPMGNAFVTGQTASKKFPTAGSFTSTNAYQTNLAGKIDAFVAAFDSTGATNLFSIYLGGKSYDFGHGIALDPSGNAYIVGRTESSKFPTTNTVPGSAYGSSRDAFVTKLLTAAPFLSVQMIAVPNQDVFPPVVDVRLAVSWPASAPEFVLECREPSALGWMPVVQPPVVINGRRQVILPTSAASCLFRLRSVIQ